MERIKFYVIIFTFCIFTINTNPIKDDVTTRRGLNERFRDLEEEEKEEVLKLEIYDAGTDDVKDLSRWFCTASSVEDLGTPNEAYSKLQNESCLSNITKELELDPDYYSMCVAFNYTFDELEYCPPGLMLAECATVLMYSSQFYATYNYNIRRGIWDPYKTFTTLLYSALTKLDEIEPLPSDTILYRGMRNKFTIDSTGRFYFKQFVSTTLDQEVAQAFGSDTMVVIVPNTPIVAARIMNLSLYPGEEEILISPFEAFELINQTDSVMYFKSSKSQDFIDNPNLQCEDSSGQLRFKFSEAVGLKSAFFTIVFIMFALITNFFS